MWRPANHQLRRYDAYWSHRQTKANLPARTEALECLICQPASMHTEESIRTFNDSSHDLSTPRAGQAKLCHASTGHLHARTLTSRCPRMNEKGELSRVAPHTQGALLPGLPCRKRNIRGELGKEAIMLYLVRVAEQMGDSGVLAKVIDPVPDPIGADTCRCVVSYHGNAPVPGGHGVGQHIGHGLRVGIADHWARADVVPMGIMAVAIPHDDRNIWATKANHQLQTPWQRPQILPLRSSAMYSLWLPGNSTHNAGRC